LPGGTLRDPRQTLHPSNILPFESRKPNFWRQIIGAIKVKTMAPTVKILSDILGNLNHFIFTQKYRLFLVNFGCFLFLKGPELLGKIRLVKIGTALESDPMTQCICIVIMRVLKFAHGASHGEKRRKKRR
jgi:hypothetical protein